MHYRKVLLSDATSYKAVVISTSIKKVYSDVEVYTCDHRSMSRFFHTKYTDHHIVLKSTINKPNDYKGELLSIIQSYKIDIFIPINSVEMDILISHKDQFGPALSYWGSYDSFKTLNQKNKLEHLCQKCGIKRPQSFDKVANIKFPVVIKPKVASSAKGVRYLPTKNELREYLKIDSDLNDMIIQEYIKGVGVGYSVFAIDGQIKVGYGHKRIAEYPVTGGSSMYRETFNDDRMVDVARRLLKLTKWSGFAMFEFKLTENNELYLIEVNPRIWGSINQGLRNGVNYFGYLLNQSKRNTQGKEIKTYFSPFIYLSLLLYILKGEFSPLVNFCRNICKNKSDINFFKDPGGWLGSLLRLI